MTEKEKLFERLSEASNKELGILHSSVSGGDPFKGTLLLPSVIRVQALKEIKDFINKGLLKFDKPS